MIHKYLKNILITACSAAGILFLAAACSHPNNSANRNNESLHDLFLTVDEEIQRCSIYMQEKEKRISLLKHTLSQEEDDSERLKTYDMLIAEYEAYVCDSALKYVEAARTVANRYGNRHEENRLLIKKADIASHAGLFTEAHEMLRDINRAQLDSFLLSNYYSAYCVLYQYESEYLPPGEYTARSRDLQAIYTDSLMAVTDPSSFLFLQNWCTPEINHKNFLVVKQRLEDNLSKYQIGSRQYSILASTLARMYEEMGDREQQKRYLLKTVISDIRGAVKENMAIRELATQVFEDGDIDRANRYMKLSLEDANFYAARMSGAQSGRMIPVIDHAYEAEQQRLQSRQLALIYITSILLLFAVVAMVLNMRQVRRVKEANRLVNHTNEELSQMSGKLKHMNEALERSNRELKNSNHTAQEYAGLFMEYASITISNLQKYHVALRNLAIQGNVKAILRKLDSGDISADALKVFYSKFDEAILNIYPYFVRKVNDLLRADEKIQLKSGEKLNTELRILALVKIGISDSDKISEFLRCSISTIYTYRSKLKRRAVDPDTFEQNVMDI